MSESNNTGLKIALVFFILISIALAGYIVYDKFIDNNDTKEVEKKEETKKEEEKKEEEPVKEKEEYKSTFSIENEAGIAYVEGYATVEHIKNDSVYASSDEEADYIFFNILKTDSKDFMQYIEESKGNSYVGDKAIGIGCKDNGIIKYYNSSDEAEEDTLYKLDKETTDKILKSTKDAPVKLKLERLEFTGGSEAPLCYSHITHVSIVE